MDAVPIPRKLLAIGPPWLRHAVWPALIVLLVVALAVAAIVSNHQRSREQAVVHAQNLARLAEARLSDHIDRIDLQLQLLALRQADQLAASAAAASVADMHLIDLDDVKFADRSGTVRARPGQARSLADGLGGRVGEQEFFRRAASDVRRGLVVVGPLQTAPDHPALMVFSRAVLDARGELEGVVFAAMGVNQLDKLFAGLDMGAHGMAALRTDDLRLVYRYPAWEQGVGVAAPPALRQAVAAAPMSGTYTAWADADGHDRISAYLRLRAYPYYVLVGQSSREAMAGWAANAALFAALAGLTVGLTLWAWLAQLRWSRRQMQALNNRFEAIVQTSSDSIISQTLDGRITTWNRGAQQMFGYSPAEIVGQPASGLAPIERRDEDAALTARVLRGEIVQAFETLRMRKDGVALDVSMSVSPILDTRGHVMGISSIGRDISGRKALEAEVRAMAFNDPLTKLPNRRLLMDRLRQAQLSSSRQRSYFGVLFIDLDGFKQVNEKFGHEVGDQLLAEVGRRLQAAVRQHDTVARLGGDEFVVLLEELGVNEKTAADHVNTVADKILDAIEHAYHLRGTPHHCSASVGIRLLVGSQDSPEQVLMDADAAMYHVKRQRRALKTFAFE